MLGFLVSYTYLTEGGNRRFESDLISIEEDHNLTPGEVAFAWIRTNVSSEAVLLGVWLTVDLKKGDFGLGGAA